MSVRIWLGEIVAEHAEAEGALAEVTKELAAASAASTAAAAAHSDARTEMLPVFKPAPGISAAPPADAIVLRFRALEQAARSAESRRIGAHAAREALRLRIADLERAIGQLTSALDAAAPAPEEAA